MYDAAGRLSYSIDSAGRLSATILYDTALSSLGADASATAIASALQAAQATGRTTLYSYDAAGNLASTTDALGYVESYSYDGAGNRLSRCDANGAIWRYGYDAAGHQTSQTSPAVLLTSVSTDANGNLVQGGTSLERIVTRLDYDALGNVLARTEAAGRAEQRTTQYGYDALGRLVRTTFPPVGVYESEDLASLAGSGPGEAARAERQATLSTATTYDIFGNAIASQDVNGNFTFKAYDALGRVLYEVDQLGQLSRYRRDTFGNAVELTRFAHALATLPLELQQAPGVQALDAAASAFALGM